MLVEENQEIRGIAPASLLSDPMIPRQYRAITGHRSALAVPNYYISSLVKVLPDKVISATDHCI